MSVSAQDSSDFNLTIDESSPVDISQSNIDVEIDETRDVEGIYESSANEQNSLDSPHGLYCLILLFKDLSI